MHVVRAAAPLVTDMDPKRRQAGHRDRLSRSGWHDSKSAIQIKEGLEMFAESSPWFDLLENVCSRSTIHQGDDDSSRIRFCRVPIADARGVGASPRLGAIKNCRS